jgi:hypothetical protein
VAVDLDDGCVDHGELHVRLVRTGLEKPNENIGFDPIAVSLEDGVPTSEKGWKVTPRASRAHDPKHGLDEAAVVAAASTRVDWLTQAMRFHLRPLGVSQHESFHPKLESQTSQKWNPESQQALERRANWVNRSDSLFGGTVIPLGTEVLHGKNNFG